MPLYEFLRLAIEKLESSQQKPCSADPSIETDQNDLVRGVSENGKIAVGGQSSRVPRSPTHAAPSVYGDANLGHSVTERIEKSGGVEYIFNGISPVLPTGDLDSHKDGTVPWHHLQDYSSGILPQTPSGSAKKVLVGVGVGDGFVSKNGSSPDQAIGDLFNNQDAVKLPSFKAHSFHSWLQQKDHISYPSITSEGFSSFCNDKGSCGDVIVGKNVASCSEGVEVKETASASRCITPLVIMQNDTDLCVPVAPTAKPEELVLDAFMTTENRLLQNNAAYPIRTLDGDRATSSVSSGNSADDTASFKEKHTQKRFCDNEEFECQSDPSPAQGGRGSKRRRAAEVHNLSERRRRDRINQKMQALQELVPNCNKADKASMLDEVIEYLKTLKHQVQMMSMGSGFCVPPLMFPPGIQHMYHPPTPHFSYMGMRMGSSPSFGCMNAVSPRFLAVPPIQGAHLPTPAMGLISLQGTPGTVLPMCGHPSSLLHRTLPGPHLLPLTRRQQTSAMRPKTSPRLNHADLITNNNSQTCKEANISTHCTSSQLQATTDVANQSTVVQEKTRATGIRSRGSSD